jgi:LemA protein
MTRESCYKRGHSLGSRPWGLSMWGWILLAAVAALVGLVIVLYNRLVKARQMVEEGWSGISVQLKRRSDLIPNLLAAVKGYMSHEKGVLERVTELRAKSEAAEGAGPAERGKIEGALSSALVRLFAVMENYPDLKASQNVIDFQKALEDIENHLQMSRRYYNGAVRNLNVMVESFPSNLVAGQFGFIKAQYFELDDEQDRAVPQVEFGN